jgi:hypothetical protein
MREPCPYVGQTLKLRADAAEIGGQPFEVQDWFDRTAGVTWRKALDAGDPRAIGYNVRRGLGGLPDDDDVLFGRLDGVGRLVHVSEIGGQSVHTPADAWRGPKTVDERAIGQKCPACGVELADGDQVAVLALGPGANKASRAKARARKPYEAVVAEMHWACATGEEL